MKVIRRRLVSDKPATHAGARKSDVLVNALSAASAPGSISDAAMRGLVSLLAFV